jgi:dUTP pyrophosphatase
MHTLYVKILPEYTDNTDLRQYYESKVNKISYKGDCGVDLMIPTQIECAVDTVTFVNMGIACRFESGSDQSANELDSNPTFCSPFMLCPRSSITKSPLMLANSVGIFDPEYRGPVIGAFRCFKDNRFESTTSESGLHIIKQGERLVQVVAFDGKPIKVVLVDELDVTTRGANGFGSTNSN